ncbi:glycosyltransferase family 39 protein [Prochlorococcus marinus]|uniref:Glycosyltransferase RgtA/B/C/D-like domain-containing protein n=1 Tax=Prochlorococcus marinus (strain MIT 9303) TaxID=59922 RepID=A2CCN8_PROM3|nr:glycosyltransferase family 39 protein [Prochlorococcus marinus]ABM79248.1 Hypothetical protein P9303_25171 [Prochlorococcus marinus str. MIT 9303]
MNKKTIAQPAHDAHSAAFTIFSLPSPSRWRICLLIIALICSAAFIFKALVAVNLTSLWNDELSTVEKSFQPSLSFLIDYLRTDVHPPFYYVILWLTGKIFGETVMVLRSFSWVAYVVGCAAISAAAWSYQKSSVASICALLLSCSIPFTVSYSVEGKAYAFLFALISIALVFRLRVIQNKTNSRYLYILTYAAVGLTHYYGLGLLIAQTLIDGIRKKSRLFSCGCLALLLPSLWMLINLGFLTSQEGREWLEPTSLLSPKLLRYLLLTALGPHWQLVLAIGLGTFLLLKFTQTNTSSPSNLFLIQAWGVDAGLLLLIITYTISIWKPSALPRYYIVLAPACLGAISCWLGAHIHSKELLKWRGVLLTGIIAILLSLFWTDSFTRIAPESPYKQRNDSNYRALSINAAASKIKLTRQCSELNASDYVLRQGRLLLPGPNWTCINNKRLLKIASKIKVGQEIVIADSKSSNLRKQRLQKDAKALEAMGFNCSKAEMIEPASQVIRCLR